MSAPPPFLRPPRSNNKAKPPKLRLPNLNLQAETFPTTLSMLQNGPNGISEGKEDLLAEVPKPVPLPSLITTKPSRINQQQNRGNVSDHDISLTLESLAISTSLTTLTQPVSSDNTTTRRSSGSGVFSAEIIAEVEHQEQHQQQQQLLLHHDDKKMVKDEQNEEQDSQDTRQSTQLNHQKPSVSTSLPPDITTLNEDQWRQLSLTNSIIPLSHLGEGTSGTVVKATIRSSASLSSQIFALKQIIVSDTETSKQLLRELRFNKQFHSEFIVKYYGMFLNERTASVYIAMEFMSGGSLDGIYKQAILKQGRILGEKVIGKINDSVLSGLAYLNCKGVIHRDIKPQNILIDGNGHTKICDFGVSGILQNSFATTFTGTSFYMAPERIQGGSYSITSDIWSWGLTLLEVSMGRFPLDLGIESSPIDILSEIVNFVPDLNVVSKKGFSESFVNFVEFCLRNNPKERPSARQLLEHPWVRGQRKKNVDMKAWIQSCRN